MTAAVAVGVGEVVVDDFAEAARHVEAAALGLGCHASWLPVLHASARQGVTAAAVADRGGFPRVLRGRVALLVYRERGGEVRIVVDDYLRLRLWVERGRALTFHEPVAEVGGLIRLRWDA